MRVLRSGLASSNTLKREVAMKSSRRHFILFAASLASMGTLSSESRGAAPELSESDPTAQALGYTSDAARVDTGKFPQFRTGQTCADCQLYQGKPGDAAGPCTVFAGKQVNAKGWCGAYTKKA